MTQPPAKKIKKTQDAQAVNWCFTLFREEGWEVIENKDPANLFDSENMDYIIYQVERCPETQKLHLQGYFALKTRKRMAQAKKLFEYPQIHLIKCLGSPLQNIEYCSKSASHIAGPWEYGVRPDARGKKSCTALAIEDIQAGKPLSQVAVENPMAWVRSYRGLTSLAAAVAKPKGVWREVTCFVFWGKSRTGKTRTAMESTCKDGRPPFRMPLSSGFWFDGYDGEDTLVIDDFYGQIKFSDMLQLLDGHYIQVPIKGGFTWAVWTKVFITSNVHPQAWWAGCRDKIPIESMQAMEKRYTEIKEFC